MNSTERTKLFNRLAMAEEEIKKNKARLEMDRNALDTWVQEYKEANALLAEDKADEEKE